ncbi:MAG: squalene synthase HpnC [Alphaproteobacteria bacterium]|nr:squalene synthase HpnC [Alphaproteobacteria bacterium]
MIEKPSGKNETTENFPVTRLVARRYKPHVKAFYIFARAADDISDDETLSPAEKLERLDRFDEALIAPEGINLDDVPSVKPLRQSLKETGVSAQHARDLLIAFKRDAEKLRYENWDELLDYCRYSANPVGRYLLELHGESQNAWPANDALCTALQIINHIQDCGEDYTKLDRVYIPLDTMEHFGARPEDLGLPALTGAMRQTLDAMLQKMNPMLKLALTFSPQVHDKMLRFDTAIISEIALRLSRELNIRDPLKERVKLSTMQKIRILGYVLIKRGV